jgi:hypothetical protein
MKNISHYQTALGRLRAALATLRPGNKAYDEIQTSRAQVLARYQPIFALDHLNQLDVEEFKSFLYLENNRHWSGLYRMGLRACNDVAKLRAALQQLLDETRPIDARIEQATKMVEGMGKALATAILLVAYPSKYGVWNNTSEAGMKALEIWPQFERGATFGRKYAQVNEGLLTLAQDLQIDMWTLDTLWWSMLDDSQTDKTGAAAIIDTDTPEPLPTVAQRFALERHLQEFLRDNWERTELGQDWAIYSEDGDDEAGCEYPTDVGRIDLLAVHRRESRWLVVELKRDQSSDETIGQVLRYMGWVKQHLAKPNDRVEGLVIAHEADDKIRYALNAVPDVSLVFYEVKFSLSHASRFGTSQK